MDWVYYILTVLVMLLGMFLSILGLPGIWLMVGVAGVFAWLTRSAGYISTTTLIVLVVLAILAEVVEFVAGSAGAKKAGGSKRAMMGAIVGGLLGGFFLTFIPIPVISTIVGVCLGAFIGAAVVELMIFKDMDRSMRVGVGAAKGRFLGIISKLIFSMAIFLIAMFAAFPLGASTVTSPTPTLPTTAPATAPLAD